MRIATTAPADMLGRTGVLTFGEVRTNRVRRVAHAVVAALMLGLASLGLAAPAQAAPVGIEFSTDGINFSPVFSGVLFPAITIVVPGDHQSSSFWVRNTSGSAGYLRVVLSDVVASGPEIADGITVSSSTPVSTGTAVPLSKAAPCWVLVEGDFVPSGKKVKVTSTLTLGNFSGAIGQNETATLSLRVGMSDAAVGGLPPTSCGGTPSTVPVGGHAVRLAMTGSETPYSLIAVSAGALGVGLFLLVAARRRRREEA